MLSVLGTNLIIFHRGFRSTIDGHRRARLVLYSLNCHASTKYGHLLGYLTCNSRIYTGDRLYSRIRTSDPLIPRPRSLHKATAAKTKWKAGSPSCKKSYLCR
ncbi:hypothetical protein AVEN_83721-1 [Araneus ventricosus]|uniref:Uncharacterized protein n=1 Tax=Araneus ventricosus TaxID=182803 RepID=A0A4Y2EWR9_ARAVE|nr:hypothetical protein AVEN_83721-1 [Araneus ventricosus]